MFHGRPLGGERVEVKGVFDALRSTISQYAEKVIGKLRG